jgi:pimeloyl-ACP methyl ester carboxylesterase
MSILQRSDVNLGYQIAGSGVPVLFIQGVGVAGEGWRLQVEGLGPGFETLTFDNRGLGSSISCHGPITIEAMAEDARHLMDSAGWESAHVVGHSMGGVIAQQLALDAPRRIRSLSLLCTFPRGKDAARVTPWVIWMSLRTRIGSRPMRRRAFLQMLFTRDYLRTTDADALAARVGALIGRDLADSPPILLKQIRALARHDVSRRLGSLTSIPTLVVSAEHDPIAPLIYGRRLSQLIPGATFEELPGAAHGVIIDQAEAVNERLRTFMESVERTRNAVKGAASR